MYVNPKRQRVQFITGLLGSLSRCLSNEHNLCDTGPDPLPIHTDDKSPVGFDRAHAKMN